MAPLKSLEHWAKLALAAVLALLLFRPWRRSRVARLGSAQRVLLVRIDPRVGEVLLTTPLVNQLNGREVHLLVHPNMVRVVEGLPGVARIWPLEKSVSALLALRAQRFDAVINCGNWSSPAATSAIVARLVAGAGVAVGPATTPTSWLMDQAVTPLPHERSEAVQRAHLVDVVAPASGPPRLSFRVPRQSEPVHAFIAGLGRFAAVNPGGRLGERRVPPSAFAAGCRAMVSQGVTPVVTWGPGEEALVEEVCALCPAAIRAVATDFDGLAAVLGAAVMTLCNNTGPMHLAVAVNSPTLALFSRIEMARWSHPGPLNRSVDVTRMLADSVALEALVERETTEFLAAVQHRRAVSS
jgi:ADP-heptose:LPS heptosyltransferase